MLWGCKSKKVTVFFSFVLFSLFSIFPTIHSALAANAIGKFTFIEGRVDVLRNGELPAVKATISDLVYVKDVVKTKSNSRAEVVFVDGNILRLAQRSKIDISEYVTEETIRKEIISLQSGKLEAIVKEELVKHISVSPDAYRFEVHTPNAVTGVRGTDYFISHVDNLSGCYVRGGKVDTYNPKFPNAIVRVRTGYITFVPENQPPEPPRPARTEEIKAFEEAIGQYPESRPEDSVSSHPPVTGSTSRSAWNTSGCKSDNDCPTGYVCGNGDCISPLDPSYSTFTNRMDGRDAQRSQQNIDQSAIDKTSASREDTGFTSAELEEEVEGIARNLGCRGDSDCLDGYRCVNGKCKKGETESAERPAETETATSTGIDIEEVGTAPSGQCRIVEGQLVPVEGWPVNIDGMTLTLAGAVEQTTTSSSSGKFSFEEFPAGDYVISVKEWDYGMTRQNFTAPSGKAIKITLKGSCPYLYVWDGETYKKENDIYSVARIYPVELMSEKGRLLAKKDGLFLQRLSVTDLPDSLVEKKSYPDYYLLKNRPAVDTEGNYRIMIKEQENERSFSDLLDLRMIDHSPGTRVGVTRGGEVVEYRDLKKADIKNNPSGAAGLFNGQTIEIILPPEAFSNGVLAVDWQGFQDGSSKGHTNAAGIKPRISLQRKDPDGQWRIMDWAYPRDEKDRSFFRLDHMESGWDAGSTIRLVATSCHSGKYHRIDEISWDRLENDELKMESLALVSALTQDGEEVGQAAIKADGKSIFLGPEEKILMTFKAEEQPKGVERSFVFVSRGVYIPMPGIRFAEK